MFAILLYEASITQIQKLDQDIRKLQTALINIDAKILNKLLANQIQNYIKGIIPSMQNWLNNESQ